MLRELDKFLVAMSLMCKQTYVTIATQDYQRWMKHFYQYKYNIVLFPLSIRVSLYLTNVLYNYAICYNIFCNYFMIVGYLCQCMMINECIVFSFTNETSE